MGGRGCIRGGVILLGRFGREMVCRCVGIRGEVYRIVVVSLHAAGGEKKKSFVEIKKLKRNRIAQKNGIYLEQ